MENLEFFSDGSSDNVKDKNAGWASIFMNARGLPFIMYGHLETPSTNNQAELIGLIGCAYLLKKLELYRGKTINSSIFSDSEYAIGCIGQNPKWSPSKNLEIIRTGTMLLKECASIIDLKWVRGHTGIEGNELADKFSRFGRQKRIMNDPRYITKYFNNKAEIMTAFSNFLKELKDGHEIC